MWVDSQGSVFKVIKSLGHGMKTGSWAVATQYKQVSGEPVSIHEIPFLARVRREARMAAKSQLALLWILCIGY